MFAVISLPEFDGDKARSKQPFPIKITVRTYWRKYNRKELTTSDEELHAQQYTFEKSVVPMTATVHSSLSPTIKKIGWFATDDKTAVISVEGENFFTGTSVLLGSAVHDSAANGLLIKSDQTLQIRTTLAALASGDVVLNGRYGPSIRLEIPGIVDSTTGIAINRQDLRLIPGQKIGNLLVWLQDKNNGDLGKGAYTRFSF